MVFSVYNLTALQLPTPTAIQVLRAPIYGVMGYRFSVLAAFATCQMVAVRIWLFAMTKTHNSTATIGFMQLLEQLNQQSERRILFWAQFISTNMLACTYLIGAFHIGIELYVSYGLWRYSFVLLFSLTLFLFVKFSANDVLILYVYALAGCTAVLDQMKIMRTALTECDRFSLLMVPFLQKYFSLIRSIERLNPLSKFIVLASELLIIPFGGMIFIFSSSPAEDLFQVLLKAIIITAAIFYALHGYLLIVVLARVDTMSKTLYSKIYCAILRSPRVTWVAVRQLLLIIEDASCSRSHLVIREYSGSVSQIDAFESITSTVSIMTLLFTFCGIGS